MNYLIVAHTTDAQISCPDGDKDVAITARIKLVGGNGRRFRTDYGFGWMCAAPVLHEGRCYSPGNDHGPAVRVKECDALSWKVTRRIDSIADIQRCSPATGLVLTEPKVAYCEIAAPLPPDLRGNPLAQSLRPVPPPAG